MDDNDTTPIYEVLFELQVRLCDRFPALTPFTLRRERAVDVFTMITRLNGFMQKENKEKNKKKNKKNIIRRPAGDNWF